MLSLGRCPGMTGHTRCSLPLYWRGRKVWARLAKGRGRAGFCLWPVGPLSRTGLLPLEEIHGCFQRPVPSTLAGCFHMPCTLLLSPGEKRFGVVLSQGP